MRMGDSLAGGYDIRVFDFATRSVKSITNGEGSNESPTFSPRIGFAWDLKGDARSVLRGGYGRYFLNPTGQGHQQGFSVSTPLVASTGTTDRARSRT